MPSHCYDSRQALYSALCRARSRSSTVSVARRTLTHRPSSKCSLPHNSLSEKPADAYHFPFNDYRQSTPENHGSFLACFQQVHATSHKPVRDYQRRGARKRYDGLHLNAYGQGRITEASNHVFHCQRAYASLSHAVSPTSHPEEKVEEVSVPNASILSEHTNRAQDPREHTHLSPGSLLAEDGGHSRQHFEKRGRALQARKARHHGLTMQGSYLHNSKKRTAQWQDICDFMSVHTPIIIPALKALRVNGYPSALSQLQRSLQDSQIHCESIIRFGNSYSMLIRGSASSLQPLCESLNQDQLQADQPWTNQIGIIDIELPSSISGKSIHADPEYHERRSLERSFEDQVDQAVEVAPHGNFRHAMSGLKSLFEAHREGQPGVTFKAFRVAIKFLLRHGEITSAIDLLLSSSQFGIAQSTTVYNIFLQECARRANIAGFDQIVRLMVKRTIPLNGSTWLAFLDLLRTPFAKSQALTEIIRLGLAKYENSARHLAAPILEQGLAAQIDRGRGIQPFLEHLSNLLGPVWPSPRAVSALVEVLIARDKLETAIAILKIIDQQYGFEPNFATLHVVLKHYATQSDTARAVEALQLFSAEWPSIVTEKFIFNRLWRLAWRGHNINLARTIWRYASVLGHAREMRKDLFPSLRHGLCVKIRGGKFPEQSALSVSERWHRTAGLLMVGDVYNRAPVAEDKDLSEEQAIAKAQRLAQAFIGKHLDRAPKLLMAKPFAIAVSEAFNMDREWARSGFRKAILDGQVSQVSCYTAPWTLKPNSGENKDGRQESSVDEAEWFEIVETQSEEP